MHCDETFLQQRVNATGTHCQLTKKCRAVLGAESLDRGVQILRVVPGNAYLARDQCTISLCRRAKCRCHAFRTIPYIYSRLMM